MDEHDGPPHYVIRIRGVLSDRLLLAFPGLQSRTDRGDTLLAGPLADQSALHGVLAQIEALRLELLGVRRSKRSVRESAESVGSDDDGSAGSSGGSQQESRSRRDQ
jgi:hypothetical protein